MRSSDATCCASMAVNTCFFSPRATTSKIWPPKPQNLVQNSFSCPRFDAPLTGTRLLYKHLQFLPQKCRKPVTVKCKIKKNPLYIRYNSKIRYIKKSKIDFQSTGCVTVSLHPLASITHASLQFYMLCTTRNQYFTS